MGKATILILGMCLMSMMGVAYCETRLFVEGKVYCDTCRTQFVTKLSQYMKDAKVRLECRETEGGSTTYSHDAMTDESGTYRIPVDGDHEDEICSVQLVKSSVSDCSEISHEPYSKLSARVSLTANNGMSTPVRQANPLGFLNKEPLPQCAQLLQQLGITPDAIY